jgi:hypothetical protein
MNGLSVHENGVLANFVRPDFKLTHYPQSGFLHCILRVELAIRSPDRFSRKLSA